MTAAADVEVEEKPKASKLPLLLGIVLALAGGGGGFYVITSGLLGGSDDAQGEDTAAESDAEKDVPGVSEVAFVPLDPLIVTLPSNTGNPTLRFRAELEVLPGKTDEVTAIKPRIVDVLNGYLRAVSLEELQDPAVLSRLRGQMLRRVQVVAGPDRVRDLLVMEFVLN